MVVVQTPRPARRMADTSSSVSSAETCPWITSNFAKYTITLLSTFLDPVHGDSKSLQKLVEMAVTIYQQTRLYTLYDMNLCTVPYNVVCFRQSHCSMQSQVLAREIDL
jgi:hypothetical protein